MLEALPSGLFQPHHTIGGLGKSVVLIGSVATALKHDVRGVRRGNPTVICGKVADEEPSDFPKEIVESLADMRLAFTFGYELTIDVKWAAQIARNGDLTKYPNLIGNNKIVRSTRHVFRKTSAGEEVVLLCNPVGTALAVESEIPDPAFVRVVRQTCADESGADDVTKP